MLTMTVQAQRLRDAGERGTQRLRKAPRAFGLDIRSSTTPKSSTLIIVATIGTALGALVVFADYPWWNDAARDLVGTPAFLTWFFLVCAEVAGWSIGAVFVYRIVHE